MCPGVIVNADLPADKRPRLQGAAFNGPPTRVLVLRNMVGPGEVDEDLEEEVSCGAGVLLVLQLPPQLHPSPHTILVCTGTALALVFTLEDQDCAVNQHGTCCVSRSHLLCLYLYA